MSHPAVQEVIVIGIPTITAARRQRPLSNCAPAPIRSRWTSCKAFLAGKLGKHEIPAALDFVDELPRTSVGKLSRHELRNQQPAQARTATTRIRRPLVTGALVTSPSSTRSGPIPRMRAWHNVGRLCSRRRWLWVPAFAGTTKRSGDDEDREGSR